MKITITTEDSIVVDIIDLDEWNWRKPIGWAVLVNRLKYALTLAEEEEEEGLA